MAVRIRLATLAKSPLRRFFGRIKYMEQTQLPVGIKITIYLMIVIIIGCFLSLISLGGFNIFMLSLDFLFIFFTFFLARKRKWAWYGLMALNLFLALLFLIPFIFSSSTEKESYESFVFSVIFFVCIILYFLFRDRKKFFEISTNRF